MLIPAAYPTVTLMLVPRRDRFGNAQIDGIPVEDIELARASRRLIISTEEGVGDDFVHCEPCRTDIAYYIVDAVCEGPFGAHPTQMPYLYFFEEPHIRSWLTQSKTAEGAQAYLENYVYGVADFSGYLDLIGTGYLDNLRSLEQIGMQP